MNFLLLLIQFQNPILKLYEILWIIYDIMKVCLKTTFWNVINKLASITFQNIICCKTSFSIFNIFPAFEGKTNREKKNNLIIHG